MDHERRLRPIERRMRKLADAGASEVEIAWRFRRTPKNVRQVMALSDLRRERDRRPPSGGLRPIERRVLRWRDAGAGFDELAARFRRGPVFLEQVEHLARYKLGR
jgi:hypothetical protein